MTTQTNPAGARSPLVTPRTWPEEFKERYRSVGLWTDETFADFVVDRCRRFADAEALVGVDVHGAPQRLTYRELERATGSMAARLTTAGAKVGDRVVVALPNVVEHLVVVLACLRHGFLPVFALPSHRVLELSSFCSRADAAVLVLSDLASDEGASVLHARVAEAVATGGGVPPALLRLEEVDDVLPSDREVDAAARTALSAETVVGAEEVAFLQLSGGTTGISKLIPRTAADYLYSVRASAEICGLGPETVMAVVLPMAHNFSMSSPGVLGALHVGATVVLVPDPSPRTALAHVARERVTDVALVPPLAQAWVAYAQRRTVDLSSLRVLQVGGARLAEPVARDVERVLGVRLQQVFGMAEGLVNYTRTDDPFELVVTTQGRPISEYDEILVVDADGAEVPVGTEGELLTRGPYTIRGYYDDARADADSFTADGFYRTGDLVRRLASGHLQVTGRSKDQINRAGEKIAAATLEDPLLALPQIHDVVAVGVPDDLLGERITLLVVPVEDAGIDASALPALVHAHLRSVGLATHALPDEVLVVEAFPTTHVGKNSRRDLRQAVAASLLSQLEVTS